MFLSVNKINKNTLLLQSDFNDENTNFHIKLKR